MITGWWLALSLAAVPVDPLVPGQPGVMRGHTDAITAVAYSPDGGSLLSAGRDGSLRFWSLSDGKETASLPALKSQVNAVAFSPDGRLVAVGNVELQVRLLEVATGAQKQVLAFPDAVLELAFSPDGAVLAVAGPSGTVMLFTVSDGKPQSLKLRGRSLCFSADGKTLALGEPGGGITLVDPRDGKVKRRIATPGHQPMLTLSADGALLATWSSKEREIHLWSGITGKALGVLALPAAKDPFEDARPETLTSLAMTRDGAWVVSASADRQLRVWDVKRRKVTVSYPLERQGVLALSPDGAQVAVGDSAQLKVWPLRP